MPTQLTIHPAESELALQLTAPEVLTLSDEDGAVLAQLALWPRTIHTLGNHVIGFIGAFQAESEALGREILAAAEERLRAAGATLAVGPIDGSTWRSYRFQTGFEGDIPPFLLEPTNPAWYPRLWEAEGYDPLAEYYSSYVPDLTHRDPQVGRAAARLAAAGITFHELDLGQWENQLAQIHALSLIAFMPNFLYEPLPLEHFAAGYAKARALVDPRLVLLARQEGALVGFSFTLPNPPQPGTVIVKTLAVLPGRDLAGLGAVLLEETHRRAAQLGYTSAIHALMHEGNRSRKLSDRYGQPFRTYTLYGKDL